jgi:hypothetical protein
MVTLRRHTAAQPSAAQRAHVTDRAPLGQTPIQGEVTTTSSNSAVVFSVANATPPEV